MTTFYTRSGWSGNKYLPYQTNKMIAKEIRKELKEDEITKNCKWSVKSSVRNISVTLISGPEEAFVDPETDYVDVNQYWIKAKKDDRLTSWAESTIIAALDIVQDYQLHDCDSSIDYFHVNFWLDISIGRWDKPYIVK